MVVAQLVEPRGPQFESSHRQKFILSRTFVYCQLCIEKTKIKKKWPGMAHFFKKIYLIKPKALTVCLVLKPRPEGGRRGWIHWAMAGPLGWLAIWFLILLIASGNAKLTRNWRNVKMIKSCFKMSFLINLISFNQWFMLKFNFYSS